MTFDQSSYLKDWHRRNPGKAKEYARRRDPSKRKAEQQRYQEKAKLDLLAAYGAECACCGESRYEFLTLDHIGGDGAGHKRRERVSGGFALYARLRKQGFPSGYRILCWNCNSAIGVYGRCPHEFERIAEALGKAEQ